MAENLFNNYPRPAYDATGALMKGITLTTAGSSTSNASSFTMTNTTSEYLWFVDIQAGDCIVTFDGTAPNPGVNGHHLYLGTNYTWAKATLAGAKFISATATSSFIMASPFQT